MSIYPSPRCQMSKSNRSWPASVKKLVAVFLCLWLLLCIVLSGPDSWSPLMTWGSDNLLDRSSSGDSVLEARLRSSPGLGPVNERDDAVEERWRHALASLEACSISPERPTWDDFFDFLQDRNNCSNMRIFGGKNGDPSADGAKGVCFHSGTAPRSEGCLVLSFGINNEWSFDDAMADLGCKVYSFDPTMGAKDHQRSQKISFHSLGLGGTKDRIWILNKRVPVDTYRGVLEHISMINRTVDYLKIDIEGSELGFFENIIYEDPYQMQFVKQIGMEIHFGGNPSTRDQLWEYFGRIRCLGFRMVFTEMNTHGHNTYMHENRRKVSTCYELVWINEAYL